MIRQNGGGNGGSGDMTWVRFKITDHAGDWNKIEVLYLGETVGTIKPGEKFAAFQLPFSFLINVDTKIYRNDGYVDTSHASFTTECPMVIEAGI